VLTVEYGGEGDAFALAAGEVGYGAGSEGREPTARRTKRAVSRTINGGRGLVGIELERGERIILPLRPQPCGRAQRRVILGGTPSFPRATTMTTSALVDALHIAMLSEVCGGWKSREDAGEMVCWMER